MSSTTLQKIVYTIASGDDMAADLCLDAATIHAVDPNTLRTPFTAAAMAGRANLIKEFAKQHAEINRPDGRGCAALHEASAFGQNEAVKTLVELGADLEAKTPQGMTALMMAAAKGYPTIVRYLLAEGADPNQRDNRGYTALAIALEKDEARCAQLLSHPVTRT